jgi:probable rRNA maturation factor
MLSAMPVSVEIVDATRRMSEREIAWLGDHIAAFTVRLHLCGSLSIRVVADPEMAAAHEEFTGVSGTTDVLTFDLTDPETQPPAPVPHPDYLLQDFSKAVPFPVEADIMICLDEATRQSARRGYAFERELLLYVVHAVLHCLGHDDHDEHAAAAMHRMEDAVLEAIGVGPVFRVEEK